MYKFSLKEKRDLAGIRFICSDSSNFEIVAYPDVHPVNSYGEPIKIVEEYEGARVYSNQFIVNNEKGAQVNLFILGTLQMLERFKADNQLDNLSQIIGFTLSAKYFELANGDVVTVIDLVSMPEGVAANIEGEVLGIRKDRENQYLLRVLIKPKTLVDVDGFKGIKLITSGGTQIYEARLLVKYDINNMHPFLKCNISCRFYKNCEQTSIYTISTSRIYAEVDEIKYVDGYVDLDNGGVRDIIYIKLHNKENVDDKYQVIVDAGDYNYSANIKLVEIALYPDLNEAQLNDKFLKAYIKKF